MKLLKVQLFCFVLFIIIAVGCNSGADKVSENKTDDVETSHNEAKSDVMNTEKEDTAKFHIPETITEDSLFMLINEVNLPEVMEAYLEKFPDGKYKDTVTIILKKAKEELAKKQLDDDAFIAAINDSSIVAVEAYLNNFADGTHKDEALAFIEFLKKFEQEKLEQTIAFNEVRQSNVVAAYEQYLKKYPKSEFRKMVQELLRKKQGEELKSLEDVNWKKALEKSTVAVVEEFLSNYPDGKYTAKAKIELALLKKEKARQTKAPPSMIYVSGGTFVMGSTSGRDDERPLHEVSVHDFYIAKHEVTNSQYATFLNSYGADQIKNGKHTGQELVYEDKWGVKKENGKWYSQTGYENYPVINVTWHGAYEYCHFYGYQLPTEAEWEYASRGGRKTREYKYSGSNLLEMIAWYQGNSISTRMIARKMPNELGLFDMSGNVWEWCSCFYGRDYYVRSPKENPTGPADGMTCVLRGGSFFEKPKLQRVAVRDFSFPIIGNYNYGFRPIKLYK